MMKIFFSNLFLSVLMLLCIGSYAQTPSAQVTHGQIVSGANASFGMLVLKVSPKGNHYKVQLVKSKLIAGTFKNTAEKVTDGKEKDLLCMVLDQHKKPIETLLIRNPLIRRMEYSEDEKTIQASVIEKTENEIVVRFRYDPAMKFLLIKKIEKNGKFKTIGKLPLNLN